MSRVRGVLMLLVACVAFWRGYHLHTSRMEFIAFGLGALALAMAIWHLTRRPDLPRT